MILMSMGKVKPKPLTGSLNQTEIVTLAVFLLGGDQHAVDTEDAAVKAQALAPGRFSWSKYPEQINLELVRVYLSSAKSSQKGAWLSGSGRTGWVLTPAGLEWARAAEKRVAGVDLSRARSESRAGSIDENRWRRERDRVRSTAAWMQWADGVRTLTPAAAAEVFRVDSYVTGQLRETKVTRLLSLFQDDKGVLPFLQCAAQVLRENGEADARPQGTIG